MQRHFAQKILSCACSVASAATAFLSYAIPAVLRDRWVGPAVEMVWRQRVTYLSPSLLAVIVPSPAGDPIAVLGVLAPANPFDSERARALESYARLVGQWLADILTLRTDPPAWTHSSDRWLPGFRCVLDRSGAVRETQGSSTALAAGVSFVDSLSSASRDRARRLLMEAMGGASAEAPRLSWAGTGVPSIAPVRAHLLFSDGRPHGFFLTGWSRSEARGAAVPLAPQAPALWAVLDIDRFGVVNGLHGRSTGDSVLRELHSRLLEFAGRSGRVWRVGGDEFALRMPLSDDPGEAPARAARLLDSVRRPFQLGDLNLSISATAGLALSPLHGDDPTQLLLLAGTAMTRGKARGRNHWTLYEPAWGQDAAECLHLESGLRNAILCDQLGLAFQPLVRLTPNGIGAPAGVEALVEWAHPLRGRVGAARFIPIAEDAGVIEEIGAWVFVQSARVYGEWRRAGLEPGRLAINVSPYQVSRPGFDSRILDLLAETGLTPEHLEIEITENRLLSEVGEACRRLERLQSAGISICLDDFGVGYSSLQLLRLLPLNALKIDRTVIAAVNDPGGVELLRAYVGLARQRGLRVVAEGVETLSQLEPLYDAGCHEAQGFLISPPLSSSSLDSFLRVRAGRSCAAEA